jgi:hypothetical protein
MRRLALLAIPIALLQAATAQALPGDPPPEQLAPADGAGVAVAPDGIPVSFTCPVYGVFESGGTPFPGGSENYSVRMASSPALGADGRLRDWVSDNQAQRRTAGARAGSAPAARRRARRRPPARTTGRSPGSARL